MRKSRDKVEGTNIKNNIRELEGALYRLVAYQKLNNKAPDLEVAKSLLKRLIQAPRKVVTSNQLIKLVADFYDLKERDLLASSRKKEIVKPRQVVMYLLREELKSSYPAIGRKLGGKDHATVINARKAINNLYETDKKFREHIDRLEKIIKNE